MDNNFDSVLDMYLFEENTLLEQLDEILLKAEVDQSFDKECIDEIFRIMHTIKGSSAMMQFSSIMTVSHKIEDLFYYIRENGIKHEYNGELIDLVFKFTDFIKGEISKIEQNKPLSDDISQYTDEIETLLIRISRQGIYEDVQGDAKKTGSNGMNQMKGDSGNLYGIKINFDDDCGMENLRAFFIVNQLRESGIDFRSKPENVESAKNASEEIIQDAFFVYFNNKKDLDAAIGIVKEALNVKNYTVIEDKEEVKEQEEIIKTNSNDNGKTKPVITAVADDSEAKHSKQSLITVNLSKLDKLVDIVGEVVIAESMVSSNPDLKSLNSDNITKATRQLRKLTDELQDIVMSLRMVPVSGIFQKMKRIVRDMGKGLNKDVELVLVGDETEVDKTIVDGISDPIMHLVRNSMDHGIENTDVRIKNGKNPKGTITLAAANTGGEILITVEDDGQGFETDKILMKAKEKGLLLRPESEYTPKEIFQLLMLPGFSTNEKVTEYSGRGVGMDVVKKNVEKVGGNVLLDSKFGKGTVITFKIPLTLAIVSGMQIVVGSSEFIIPIKNIQQSFNVSAKDIIYNPDGTEMIILRDQCYPIERLHKIFDLETEVTNLEDGILILVEADERKSCLFVDRILGEQQVVVKPLPTLLNKYKVKDSGVSGCSILGDGSISLILDISSLNENII